MQITITATTDTISPDMAARLALAQDRSRIHQAIGLALKSLTKRAFNTPSLRAANWPAKTDNTPATLRKSGTLAKSINDPIATETSVTIGTDRHYAAIHQLGGKTSPHIIRPKTKKALKTPYGVFKKINHPGSRIPARPFFPFDSLGQPTARASRDIINVMDAAITPRT
jgi:phage gpG-like protein